MRGLDGGVAVVTGAAQGMGRASAERFAEEGASVVLGDIDAEGGEAVAADIREAGGEATFVEADVTEAADVELLVETAVDTYGGLDFAHNNAGGMAGVPAGQLVDRTEEQFERVLDLNLKGVWRGLKYQIAAMLESGGGAVVNTSSTSGRMVTRRGIEPYNAAKAGVIGVSRAAAMQYAREGVRVNVIVPGSTASAGAMEGVSEEQRAQMGERVPMGRLAEPEEIAGAVAWMCSEDASYLTGEVISVDGGYRIG